MVSRSKSSARQLISLGFVLGTSVLLVIGLAVFVENSAGEGGDVVFVGDSYIAGDGAPRGKGLALLAAAELGLSPTISADSGSGYTRAGRRGFTTGELVATAPERTNAELVILASGYNDNLGSPPNPDRLIAEARSVVATTIARWPRAQVIVLGPWTPRGTPSVNQVAVNNALRRVTDSASATFIDTLTRPLVTASMIGADTVHPTPAGHKAIADDLAGRLRSASAL